MGQCARGRSFYSAARTCDQDLLGAKGLSDVVLYRAKCHTRMHTSEDELLICALEGALTLRRVPHLTVAHACCSCSITELPPLCWCDTISRALAAFPVCKGDLSNRPTWDGLGRFEELH